jgi:hypothetical protein
LKLTDHAQCTSPVVFEEISPCISGLRPSEVLPKLEGRAVIFFRASSGSWW